MPLVAAAVCPHPPLLVPEMAAHAAGELDDLRSACDEAIDFMWSAKLDEIVVIGSGSITESYGPLDVGTFAPYGVPAAFSLGGQAAAVGSGARLPLSLTVGAWLLRSRPARPPRRGLCVIQGLPASDCAGVGAALNRSGVRLGLLIMGDGSACRGDKSPGYADPRAEAFDASVTKAFAEADADALLAIDADVARDLLVAGRAPWQVLAGAALDAGALDAGALDAGTDVIGGMWRGRVLYDAAPYGVNYTVATWQRT